MNLCGFRAGRNRNRDSDEVVLHGDGADGISFVEIRIALRHGDELEGAVVELDVDARLQSRPKGEVGKELEDEGRGGGGEMR